MEMPTLTSESVWMIGLIIIALALGAIIFMLNPQLQKTTLSLLCSMYYDINFFFFGPRPSIELCPSMLGASTTTTTVPGLVSH